MKKEIFIIDIHSFVDVITNSSTELFMLETDKSLELVREIVKEKEKEFPPDYGHYVTVDYCDDYFLNEAFGWFNDEDIENTIKYLEGKGYTIIPPEENKKSKYIAISSERGGQHPELSNFIKENFNVIHYTCEA
jgi:hypothetical protein